VILGIPVINRPDLLRVCLESIDTEVRLVVIDNSGTGELGDLAAEIRPDALIVDPPSNLGVAASWNFIIRSFPAEPYWLIANADAVFGPGDLERLAIDTPDPRWVGVNGDWRVFGINAACIDRVGWFDENFHPIYCEDADYEYRCSLAGVPWSFIDGTTSHAGSAAYRSDPRYADANARTYPANRAYYEAKWGGALRGGERFTTPFDAGGSVADWRLDRARLASQSW
jgi:GT2 family glycosyltransferase